MQFYLGLAVLSVAIVASSAQFGGESYVAENNPDVQEAKGLVFQELREQARHLPGSPSVDITDLRVTQQVVAGILYNMSFRAVYAYSGGRRVVKSCSAKVVSPVNSNRLTFVDPNNKVQCF